MLLLASLQPACSEKTCTPSNGDNTQAGPAFECSAGEICYLGKCFTTCNAGAELADRCSSDDDCSGARPNCVRGTCSSCFELQTCVPTLNICQPVAEVDIPERRERPDQPQPVPRPLDAGFVSGGIKKPEPDAGVAEQPVDREVTRAVLVDIARQFNFSPLPAREIPIVAIRSYNTAIGAGNGLTWRVEFDPPRVEIPYPDPAEDPNAPTDTVAGPCELRRLVERTGPLGAPQPANIGDITLANPAAFPNSITPELTANFNGPGYSVTPTVTANFLRFSVSEPTEAHFVLVSGEPLDGITEAWPEVAGSGHHVPFELLPSPQTETNLRNGYRVANPANEDLVFRYTRIENDNDIFEAVFVRITGRTTELFCIQREGAGFGGELRVNASILNAFRREEGLTGQQPYDLFFERASREVIQPPAPEDSLVLITVRVRHSLRARILFD